MSKQAEVNVEAARSWIEEHLLENGQLRLATAEAVKLVKSQPKPFQVAIVRACVQKLPELREQWADREVYKIGEQLYTVLTRLYSTKLPFEEPDICDILRTATHSCGHGCDVHSPIDRAISYLSRQPASPEILSALAAYAEGMKGLGSIAAQTVKRKVAILLLLDDSLTLAGLPKAAWSRGFTSSLAGMSPEERQAWQTLILSFKLNETSELPNTFKKVAQAFLAEMGEEQVLSRLSAWWPQAGAVCKLDTGGSHLLKHFVWLLDSIDAESVIKPACHPLVLGLSEVEWKPKQPAAKVVGAAVNYLVKLPKAVAWEPLQLLAAMAPSRANSIGDTIKQYAATE